MKAFQLLITDAHRSVATLDAIWSQTHFDVGLLDQNNATLLHLVVSLLPERANGLASDAVHPVVAWLIDHQVPFTADSRGITALDMMDGSTLGKNYPGTLTALRAARIAHEITIEKQKLNATFEEDGVLDVTVPRPRL